MSTSESPTNTASEASRSSRFRRGVLWLLVLLLLVSAWLILSPSPIDAVAFNPAAAPPLAGPTAPNDLLGNAEPLAVGQISGPEDVDVDAQGRVYAGLADGRVVRIAEHGAGAVETFAQTGGRPLGLDFDAAGNLIVADAKRGLLSIDPQGQVTVLATEAAGVPFGFPDDVVVARDGAIYFSDASTKYGVEAFLYDMLEARPWGRLIKYDPATKTASVLLDKLYFANGVALSQDESFIVVNETYRYRITRYWLSGPRAGQSEVFVDNLPGFPDGISSNERGTFWVAMYTVRNSTADMLHPRPAFKNVMAKLPRPLWPKPERYGLVLAVDEQGQVVRSLHDPSGQAAWEVTSVHERDGTLYLGTLHADRINRVAVP